MHLIYNVFFSNFHRTRKHFEVNKLHIFCHIFFNPWFPCLFQTENNEPNKCFILFYIVLYCLFLALLCNFEVIYVYAALCLRWIQLWKLAYFFFYDWAINETECFEKYKWIKEEIKCIHTYTSWNSANKIPHYELISKFYLHVPTLTINQFVIWKHFS